MSRSGYFDDYQDDYLAIGRWRGQVASVIRGKNGQQFLRELLAALDAMPEKRLIAEELKAGDEVCALGSLGVARGVDMGPLDPDDYNTLANVFATRPQLIQEIEYLNDEGGLSRETPEERWARMRRWVASEITEHVA